MKLRKKRGVVIGLVLTGCLLVHLFVVLNTAQAAAGAREYVQLRASIPLSDNLVALTGKTVAISLISGQTVAGVVKEVQSNLLHLEKLSQKEFYDALIRIDQIVAIEVRAR